MLQVAASTGNTDVIHLLVDNGASVDQTDIYGSTALHLTVVNGRLDAGRVLMNCRSDVNAYDNDGWTALHLAAEMGHLPLVRLFIGNKAYVECQTKFGRTPLHWACCRGHIQVICQSPLLTSVQKDRGWPFMHLYAPNVQEFLGESFQYVGELKRSNSSCIKLFTTYNLYTF